MQFLTPLNLPKGETFGLRSEWLLHFTPLLSPPLEGLGEVGVGGAQNEDEIITTLHCSDYLILS